MNYEVNVKITGSLVINCNEDLAEDKIRDFVLNEVEKNPHTLLDTLLGPSNITKFDIDVKSEKARADIILTVTNNIYKMDYNNE